MMNLFLLLLAIGLAIFNLHRFLRQGRRRLSLAMFFFWTLLAALIVTKQYWLKPPLLLLLLLALYFRFANREAPHSETAVPETAPAETTDLSPLSNLDASEIDRLIEDAGETPDREHLRPLNRALFSLTEWWTVMVERDGGTQPFVGRVEELPALLLFTDAERAQAALSLIGRLDANGKPKIEAISPQAIVNNPEPYRSLGVQRLQFNLRYYFPLEGLRDQYYYEMRPHDFKCLTVAAESESAEALVALWQALFDLPKWFFLACQQGEGETPTLIGGELDGGRVVFLYLSYDYAQEEAMRLTATGAEAYELRIFTPEEGFRLIETMAPDGILLRDEGVCAGARLEKLRAAHEMFGKGGSL